MAGLARMHEERRRAGGGEGGGELLADVPALADAGDDHAALGGGQRRHRPAEGGAQLLVERRPQALQALAFEIERARGGAAARDGEGSTTLSLRRTALAGIGVASE